jgi:hypothetical protein
VDLVLRGACPRAGDVAHELAPLLRHFHVAASGAGEGVATAIVADEGKSFSIEVLDTVRRVEDETHDCVERARIAAVLIALALEPATSPFEDKRALERPQEPAAPAPVETPPSLVEMSVELGVMAGFAAADDGVVPGIGALAGFRAGNRRWASRLGIGYLPEEEHHFGSALVTLTRFPSDLAVSYAIRFEDFMIEPALGLALDPFLVNVEGLAQSSRELRLDVGPRAMLSIASGSKAVSALAMLRAAWFPRPYELVVKPTGEVGKTPELRVELALGLRFDLD